MLISERHKALILRLKDPARVTNVLNSAKTLEHEGQTLVVAPHRMGEYKLLLNLGLNPPHPMDYYYDWPGRYQPMNAQRETARFLVTHSRAYCLDDLGTGKTMSTAWAFDFLREQGLAKKALVVAPLSTLERTWADHLWEHFPHLEYVVLHGPAERRRELLQRDVDVYIINHDGVKILLPDLVKRTDIDTIIIDELSQVARNAQTGRWKALKDLVAKRERVWGLTGTPVPNEPTDAWAQCRLLTPSTVPPFYTHFRDLTMRQLGQFKWVPRDNALDTVHRAMQPAIRHKRDECIDLPPCVVETREAPLTKDQSVVYKAMWDHLYAEYAGGEITAANEAVKAMRLVQICCGAANGDDGVVFIPPRPRINVLLETIEEAASKTIVFVPFKSALKMVHAEVSKHYSAEMIYGEVGKSERDRILAAFQKSTHPQVLVAQPGTMSHGLTLTAASVIVWFAPITSAEIYEQANARITRPGQRHSQLIIRIQGSPLEARMYNRLHNKLSMQGTLLAMFKEKT